MSSQIPNHPVTPEAMARLTLDEQLAFEAATLTVAQDQKPSLEVIATLVLAIQRLITEPAAAEAKLAEIAEHRNAACAALRIAETQARYPAGDEVTAERYRAAREALEGTGGEGADRG